MDDYVLAKKGHYQCQVIHWQEMVRIEYRISGMEAVETLY